MDHYVGLDVSLEQTSVCVVDGDGKTLWQGKCASSPEALAATIRARAPAAVRIGLESGPLSSWHWHELRKLGLPVVCLDARHAKAALALQLNKTDRNDARGLAQIVRTGDRAHVDRVRALVAGGPLEQVAEALLAAWEAIGSQVAALSRRLVAMARQDQAVRRLMTAPGVGTLVALAYASVIDDPERFHRSSSVGAYLGLTPRRHQSGEEDYAGHISRCGDRLLRSYLFEAAGVVLHRVSKWSALKAWGTRLAKRIGTKKATVAVARKLSVILHRMLRDGSEFRWSAREAQPA